MRNFALILGLAWVFAIAAPAQITSGSLSGTVVDPSGHVVPGAAVTLTSEVNAERRSAKTNEAGDFIFPGLLPGAYTLRVEAKGFRTLERKNNMVGATGRTAVGRLQVEVGALAESVTITARGQGVATTTTSQESVLDSKQVTMISDRGRNVMTLLRILPGVQQGRDETDAFGGNFGTRIPNIGGRQDGNTVYVDGINGGDAGNGLLLTASTSIDAIAEVNVQLGSYAAQYGLKGGAQVNLITKRGGDQYHGSAYWYQRNEFFNANNFFSNKNNLPRVVYRYSTLGGTLGGRVPVKIPILNPTGHELFFFYSLEDAKVKQPGSGAGQDPQGSIDRWTMPTARERAGDFSQSLSTRGGLIVVNDPLNSNAPFPNNIIPSDRRNVYGVALMNIMPLPNYAGQCSGVSAGCNFLWQERSLDHPRRQHLYRFDLRPTAKDSFSVKHQTWAAQIVGVRSPAGGSSWGLYQNLYAYFNEVGNVSYTRTISPSIVNEFSSAVLLDRATAMPANEAEWQKIQRQHHGLSGLGQFAPQLNPYNLVPTVALGTLPNASYNGAAPISYDARTPNRTSKIAFAASNNLTYIRGAHLFKMGIMREFEGRGGSRTGIFAGQFNFAIDSNDPGNYGYAYANMFTGHVRQYNEQLGRVPADRYQVTWAWFVQDTWKVRRNVSLDIGLRMYKWSPAYSLSGEASAFSFERYDPTWGGKPPVLFRPVSTARGRRAENPLTGEIFPATYIGMMVPGTGYSCNKPITGGANKTPCLFNGIVRQDDGHYLEKGARGFVDYLPLQYDPRVGLAWDVFGNGKMAIRTSFGVMHNAMGGEPFVGGPAWQFTKSVYFTDMNSFLTSSSAVTPISVTGAWRKGAKAPLNYHITAGIQRALPWHTVLDVAYFGYITHHNTETWDFNALPAGVRFLPSSNDPTTNRPLPDVFLRPTIGWGAINIQGPATKSRYDSLQVQANRRFVGGVELGGTFTYAGGTSDGWNQNNPLPSTAARSRNLNVQQLVFNLSYVVDLTRGSKLVKLRGSKWVLDGWQLSGITTFANGNLSDVRFSTTDGFDFTGGGESCGVVQTRDAKLARSQRTINQWFNTSVFQRPRGRGDIGNNCNNAKFRLPGFSNHDMSLFKNFPIRESKVIQLRWEIYNVFNHTQYNAVDTTANFNPAGVQTRATFGQVTSARTERRMQLALRFNF